MGRLVLILARSHGWRVANLVEVDIHPLELQVGGPVVAAEVNDMISRDG
jgi:hypothetical protein